MSHIGKKPVEIPEGVEAEVKGQKVRIKGPKGELERKVRPEIKVEKKEEKIVFSIKKKGKRSKAFFGTERALVANMVKGVTEGYEKRLRLEGVGYRGNIQDGKLVLQVGFSHDVEIKIPEGLEFEVKGKVIIISGIRKDQVHQMASKIRGIRPPDPYTGKGIRYEGEEVKLKPGKKAIGAEA